MRSLKEAFGCLLDEDAKLDGFTASYFFPKFNLLFITLCIPTGILPLFAVITQIDDFPVGPIWLLGISCFALPVFFYLINKSQTIAIYLNKTQMLVVTGWLGSHSEKVDRRNLTIERKTRKQANRIGHSYWLDYTVYDKTDGHKVTFLRFQTNEDYVLLPQKNKLSFPLSFFKSEYYDRDELISELESLQPRTEG